MLSLELIAGSDDVTVLESTVLVIDVNAAFVSVAMSAVAVATPPGSTADSARSTSVGLSAVMAALSWSTRFPPEETSVESLF